MNSTEASEQCSFYTPVNVYLVLVGAFGLFLNIFPLFVCLRRRNLLRRSSRDVLLASLIIADILTVCVPLPSYLAMYDGCVGYEVDSEPGRPSICEVFHLMFVWVKVTALFIITTLNYTSYLAVSSRGRAVVYRSIGDRLSTSFSCSREKSRAKEARTSSIVIANLVVGIGLVAFLIASLPYLGLGPEKGRADLKGSLRNVCSLEQVSYPSKGKEYTFLFAVLMSSSACFLLQVVHNLTSSFSCRRDSRDPKGTAAQSKPDTNHVLRRQPTTDQSYAKLMCILGLLFHLTWMPVMVSKSCFSGFKFVFIQPRIFVLLFQQETVYWQRFWSKIHNRRQYE